MYKLYTLVLCNMYKCNMYKFICTLICIYVNSANGMLALQELTCKSLKSAVSKMSRIWPARSVTIIFVSMPAIVISGCTSFSQILIPFFLPPMGLMNSITFRGRYVRPETIGYKLNSIFNSLNSSFLKFELYQNLTLIDAINQIRILENSLNKIVYVCICTYGHKISK